MTPATEELIREGARNAVRVCMGVRAGDRVFVIADEKRAAIGEALRQEALAVTPTVTMRLLEEYGPRPLTSFPEALRSDLQRARPTVTFFAATAQPGELGLRMPLREFLVHDLRVRHGHMPGVDERLMVQGMRADYRHVEAVTRRVYERARKATTCRVTNPLGTDITATFSPRLRWVPCTGIYWEQGQWGNLPEGETFTSPERLEGVIVAEVLGDYFSEKYGVLATPVTFVVRDSWVVEVRCADASIAKEVLAYLDSADNGRRAGEFAIGTNVALTGLTGNLLQDEKLPGVHVAFGNPYPTETGADWTSKVHVDVIPTRCTIALDGEPIMIDGRFLPALLTEP